jgi:hypothetical protein
MFYLPSSQTKSQKIAHPPISGLGKARVSTSAEVVIIWLSMFYRHWTSADVLAVPAVPLLKHDAKYLIFNQHNAERMVR